MVEDRAHDTLLYAGALRVDVNDWFFTKDKIIVSNIELDDAVINCKRKTEEWNYQFIIDGLSGTSSSSKDTSAGKDIALELKKIKLHHFSYNTFDRWKGEDMIVAFKDATVLMDKVDAANGVFVVNKLDADEPVFGLNNYDGFRPPELDTAKGGFVDSSVNVTVNAIRIRNGKFISDQLRDRAIYPLGHFDETHFIFSNINATIDTLRIQYAVIAARLDVSAKERSGFEVKRLSAKMKMTEHLMEFDQLNARTNKSQLGHYYAMRYNNFKDDMNEFITNVKIEGDFSNSVIHSDDIAFFAPELQSWHKVIRIEKGKAKGTVDDFVVNNSAISSGHTFINGDLEMKGLPDIDHTFILFNSEGSTTNYADVSSIIPDLKSITKPRLDKLGDVYFKGRFTGFLSNFVASGFINTQLGTITSDINIQLPDNKPAVYKGKLVTSGFQLGQFTDNAQLGRVSVDGKVEGKGFELKDLNARFNGYVPQFEWNGYNFKQIRVNGNFEKNQFNGHLDMNDSNLTIKGLEGKLTLSKKDIAFHLKADVKHANLKKINLTQQSLNLSGIFNLDFTGNNIDNFLGEARITDACLDNEARKLSFNYLTINSRKEDGHKSLMINSDEIQGEISGDFKILELPNAFKGFLSKYYPAYIQKPSYPVSNQDFSFFIKTKQFEDYLKVFDKNISGGNDLILSGNLNINKNELNVQGDVPQFGYDKKMFNRIVLNAKGNSDTLASGISIGEIYVDDSLRFPDTRLQFTSYNDITDVHINTGDASTINNTDINARLQTLTDGVKIHLYPSSFILKEEKWDLQKDGEVFVKKNFLDISGLRLSHDDEQVNISTSINEVNDQTDIVAEIKLVDLNDFIPYLFTDPVINGKLTGVATVSDLFGHPKIDFKGHTDKVNIDGENYGRIDIAGYANTQTGHVDFEGSSTDTGNIFKITGKYNYLDSTNNSLLTKISGEKVKLSLLEPYLNSVFSDIDGVAQTDLQIFGSPDHKYITGNVKVNNGSFCVGFTQCRYFINNQVINFSKDQIGLNYVKITDSLNNNAVLNGAILHQFFDGFVFDNLRMETSKLSLLNTKKKDNPVFYGNIIGNARMNMNGPLSNLQMDITGTPNDIDTSQIYLSTTESKESNLIDYINFEQLGTQMEESRTGDNTNIILNLKINARPSCKVDVILDEETGDVIHGQGTGAINIRVGNIEPLSMRGTYKLTKGDYTFNFQTFLKKPFSLNSGGTITWNGDPFQAMIDIDANYVAKNVDISNLSNSSGFKQKEDITIVSHINGILQNPSVKFDFVLPEKSDARRDEIIVKRLADFKNDDNEMNKQVASLLLFNTFIIGNQNFLSQGNASTLITNTIGGVVSNLLTNFFNRELEKATKGILSTYIDINPTLDLQKSASQLQANVRAGLKILLSNRLVALVGGNLDYNNTSYTQQLDKKGLITPDITVEWLINKDGTLRVVGFNKSSIDLTQNQRNRSGLQLSYRKDFNKFSDLFKKSKKAPVDDIKVIVP